MRSLYIPALFLISSISNACYLLVPEDKHSYYNSAFFVGAYTESESLYLPSLKVLDNKLTDLYWASVPFDVCGLELIMDYGKQAELVEMMMNSTKEGYLAGLAYSKNVGK